MIWFKIKFYGETSYNLLLKDILFQKFKLLIVNSNLIII